MPMIPQIIFFFFLMHVFQLEHSVLNSWYQSSLVDGQQKIHSQAGNWTKWDG